MIAFFYRLFLTPFFVFLPLLALLVLPPNEASGQCQAQFTLAKDTVCSGDSLAVTNNASGQKPTYQWELLDTGGSVLTTQTADTPRYAFTNTTGSVQSYAVRLIVSDTTGCSDSAKQSVAVRPEPSAAFGVDSSSFCQQGTVSFSDSSAGSGLAYQWDFGDPSTASDTSTATNPNYNYQDTGTYQPTMTVTNNKGCTDQSSTTVTIAEPPTAAFRISDNCQSLTTQFSDATQTFQDTVQQWSWDFGDGATSTKPAPGYQYASKGTYQVSLKVTTVGGCVDSAKDSITIYKAPTASIKDSAICKGQDVGFSGSVPNAATTYQWQFGDGAVQSQSFNPFHVYNNSGKFEPGLAATYPGGRTCTVPTDSLTVFEKPQINARITTADTQCSKGNQLCLQDSTPASSNIALKSRTILYGDGSQDTDNGSGVKTFCHTYSQFGNTYDVNLSITNREGCQASKQFDSAVFVRQPWSPRFQTQHQTQCFETPVTFQNTSGLDSSNAESFKWNFGDGGTDSTQWTGFTRTYTQNGAFSPTLTVTSQYGCTKAYTLTDGAENVAFNFNVTASADTLCFDNNTLNLSQPPISNADFTWIYGDGATENQNVTNWTTSHRYDKPGEYVYKLRVSNGQCDTTSDPDTVQIIGVKPKLLDPLNAFQCDITDSVIFADQSEHYGVPNTQRLWDFGDTTAPSCTTNTAKNQNVNRNCRYSRDSINVTHQYPPGQPDCYTTSLTFTDTASGCSSSASATAALEPPVAGPDTAHDPPLVGARFNVSSECLGPEGRKTVSVDLSETQPQCDREDFWVMWDSACARQSGNFSGQWELGARSNSYTYDDKTCESDGTRTIGVVIKNGEDSSGNTCYDTAWYTDAIQHNDVDPRFSSNFQPGKDRCPPVDVTFSLNDTTRQDSVTSYTWELGDTTIVKSRPTPVKTTFDEHREYEVSLTVKQTDGCEATISSQSNGFKDYPIGFRSGLTVSPRSICKGESIRFRDSVKYWDTTDQDLGGNRTPNYWSQSSRIQAGLETLKWDLDGSGGFSKPTHDTAKTYDTIGTYDVRLAIKDSSGCRDTITRRDFIKVYGVNTDFTTKTNQLICTPQVQFLDSSRLVDSGTSFAGHPNDTLVSWEWTFGDGKPKSFIRNPIHNYTTNDTFQVELRNQSAFGCRDSLTKTYRIPGPQPAFSITGGDTLGCIPLEADFNNQSTNTSSYVWQFGDPSNNVLSTKADTNVQFTYQDAGTYSVFLIGRDSVTNPVTNATEFCQTTFPDTTIAPKKRVTVREKPVSRFQAITPCDTTLVTFQEQAKAPSSTTVKSYQWQFDTLGSATGPNPAFDFSNPGNYQVELVITSKAGCRDTVSKSVTVPFNPSAQFGVKRACAGQPVTFSDQTTIQQDTVTSWEWLFGDGNSSFAQNPQHTYTTGGTYQVRLIATTDKGCRDTITRNVAIPTGPSPSFSVGRRCTGQDVQLTNTTTFDSGALTYKWEFGDGSTATKAAPTKAYSSSGTYTLQLQATAQYTGFSCTDSVQQSVLIEPTPSAQFAVSNTCRSQAASFTDQSSISTGSISAYSWQFGDGGTAATASPTYQYGSDGSYKPELVVTSGTGCQDTTSQTLQVYPEPSASFQASGACEEDTISFQNTASITSGSLSYNWQFGDGASSTASSPDKAYTNDGTYTPQLVASSGKGCTDTTTNTIVIDPRSQPAFSFTDACENDTVTFTNNTTGPTGTTYQWEFGDGSGSTLNNPENSYATNGNYTVQLESTTPKGCTDSLKQTIAINPRANPGYTVNNSCVNQAVSFQNQTTVDSGSLSYQWDFGDGNTSTATNPTNSYGSYQPYSITLTATTGEGCVNDTSGTLQPYPLPQNSFTVPDTCLNKPHKFRNNSTIAKGSLSYQWDFGDGNSASGKTPTYVYAKAGSYSPQLTATSNRGCQDSSSQTVQVFNKPSASFTFTSQCQPRAIPFTDQSTTASGNSIQTYSWNFGDGGISSQASPAYQYSSYGDYRVSLRVTNNRGCKDTVAQEVTSYAKPQASFTADTVCRPETTAFQDQSTVARGTVQSWSWNFGANNATANQQNPRYTYGQSGIFQPELIVTSNQNCKDTISRAVRVNPRPDPGFTVNDTCRNEPTAFRDTSTIPSGAIVSRRWLLGDGSDRRNQENFTYTYAQPGTYQAKLIAASDKGCIDSVSQATTVQFLPEAHFGSDTVCARQQTTFTDSSAVRQSRLSRWQWRFGDGAQSTVTNPVNAYDTGGIYTTQLVVASAQGCLDTAQRSTKVNYKPRAGFKVDSVCFPDSSSFTDTSKVTNGTIQQWSWQFGDGGTATGQNPAYAYPGFGSFTATLIATSNKGCQDTAQNAARVNPRPTADFSFKDTCQPNPVLFGQRSTVSVGNLNTYSWDFGDGSISADTAPAYQYDSFGRYDVQLAVKTGQGCSNDTTKTVEVYPKPSAGFTVADICRVDTAQFQDTSSVPQVNLQQWSWQFGDDSSGTGASPIHTYDAADTYNVRLIVTSTDGCRDTASSALTVYPMPQSAFTTNDTAQCLEAENFAFTNETQIQWGSIDYRWRSYLLADTSKTDTGRQTTYQRTFADTGDYEVRLLATSDFGCQTRDSQVVQVFPDPQARFRADKGCINAPLKLRDRSEVAKGTVDSWQWQTGNNTRQTQQNPEVPYDTGGVYRIQLIATTNIGCDDTTAQLNRIYGIPASAEIRRATVVADSFSRIEWSPSPSPNPGFYELYRSTQAPGSRGQSIGTYQENDTIARDYDALVDSQDYFYTLDFRDSCGIGYPHLNYGRTINLSAETATRYPELKFNPYEGWDSGVLDYQVQWRNLGSDQFQPVRFIDTSPYTDSITRKEGNPYCYRVVARRKGNPAIVSASNESCVNSESRIFVPEAFTPNGDGDNDAFRPKGSYVLDYNIKVYNRWGERVFESNSRDKSWKGRYQGQLAPQGLYQYVIRVEGTEGVISKTGSVMLIR